MTVVNMQTGEVIAHMSATSARESVERARTHLEAAAEEVVRQINGRAWVPLGYASWDEMREAEYRGAAVIVPRADRPELVARLRSEGLSQKEIGDTLGVSHQSVGRDLRNVQTDNDDEAHPPTRTDSLGRERPTTYAPRVRDDLPDSPPEPVEDLGDSAPPVPNRELVDVLEERMPGTKTDLARSSLRARWSKDMAGVADVDLLNPADVRAVLDDSELRMAVSTLRRIAKWADRLEEAGKPGLRVVGGTDA